MADKISVRKYTFSAMFKEPRQWSSPVRAVAPTHSPIRMSSGPLFFDPLNIKDTRM